MSVKKARPPWRNMPTKNTMAQMPTTSLVSTPESSLSLICSGVSSSSACAMASAILPISVFMPVATTTATPRPYTTVEPM